MFDEIRELAATLTEKVFNRGTYDVSTTTSRAGFYNHERPNVLREPGICDPQYLSPATSFRPAPRFAISGRPPMSAPRMPLGSARGLRALQQTWPGHLEICQDAYELGPSLV
jgi:hypothetical protein